MRKILACFVVFATVFAPSFAQILQTQVQTSASQFPPTTPPVSPITLKDDLDVLRYWLSNATAQPAHNHDTKYLKLTGGSLSGALATNSTLSAATAYLYNGGVGTAGNVLRSNGTTGFVPAAVGWGDINGAPTSLPPSGAASGDLTGNYPSPTVATSVITLAKMANLAANSIIGNNTASPATPIALTGAQVKTLLSLVKGDVGLGNVDNTSDANKPVSTATQTALNLKANIATPVFTTNITSPIVYGSASANGTLTIQGNSATTGNTAANANTIFKVGDSGATTAMTILNSGNVGIGVSPAEKLHVQASVAGTVAERITNLQSGTTAAPTFAALQLNGYSNYPKALIAATDQSGSTAASSLRFSVNNAAGGMPEVMRIDGATGRVLIGTTATTGRLYSYTTANDAVVNIRGQHDASVLQDGTANTGTPVVLASTYCAFKFEAASAYTASGISLWLKSNGTITNPTGAYTGELWSDSAGVPGAKLSGTSVLRFGTITSSLVQYYFACNSALTSGTSYWIILKSTADPTGSTISSDASAAGVGQYATSIDGLAWTLADNITGKFSILGVTGIGVYGLSTLNNGLYGYSETNTAIYGTSGRGIGVYGISKDYYGVYGQSNNNSGGYFASTNSDGVRAISTSGTALSGTSTSSYAVNGASTSGVGAYFTSGTSTGLLAYQSGASATTVTAYIQRTSASTGTGNVLQVDDNSTLANVPYASRGNLQLFKAATSTVLAVNGSGGIAQTQSVPPASTTGNGTAAQVSLSIAGAAGGATSYATGSVVGGAGASQALTAGAGGASSGAATTGTGGAGGGITLTAGAGGAATNATTNNGGDGGSITLRSGAGGAGSTATGAAGVVLVKPYGNSLTAFQVQPSGSTTPVVNVDTTNSRFGIGLASPGTTVDIAAASTTIAGNVSGNAQSNLAIMSNNAVAADKGGTLGFGGVYHSNGARGLFGAITGRKDNGTSGTLDGYLSFHTWTGATGLVERMRISSAGVVSIGTATNSGSIVINESSAPTSTTLSCNSSGALVATNGFTTAGSVTGSQIYAGGGSVFGSLSAAVLTLKTATPVTRTLTADATGMTFDVNSPVTMSRLKMYDGSSSTSDLYFNGTNWSIEDGLAAENIVSVQTSVVTTSKASLKPTGMFVDPDGTLTQPEQSIVLQSGTFATSAPLSVPAISSPSGLVVAPSGSADFVSYYISSYNATGESDPMLYQIAYNSGQGPFAISWTAVPGATGYRLYGDGDVSGTGLVLDTTSTSMEFYTDPPVGDGTTPVPTSNTTGKISVGALAALEPGTLTLSKAGSSGHISFDGVGVGIDTGLTVNGSISGDISAAHITSGTLSNDRLPGVPVQTFTSSGTISTGNFIVVNASNNTVVTLPSNPITGRVIYVKRTDATAYTVTVATPSGVTMDGVTTMRLSSQYDILRLIFGGTNWSVI